MTSYQSIEEQKKAKAPAFINVETPPFGNNAEVFQGEAPPRQYVVKDKIQAGTVTLLAAPGEINIGLTMLYLALGVTSGKTGYQVLGNEICSYGVAIYYDAQCSQDEVKRQLAEIDQDGERKNLDHDLYLISLLTALHGAKRRSESSIFNELHQGLLTVVNLKLVVFNGLTLNTETLPRFSALAAESGAAVIVTQYIKDRVQGGGLIRTPEQAFKKIGENIDHVGAAYAIWRLGDLEGKEICRKNGVRYRWDKPYAGALVKGHSDYAIDKFIRDDTSGRLRDYDDEKILSALLKADIDRAAKKGRPYTVTGTWGIGESRKQLTPPLNGLTKKRIVELAKRLLETEQIYKGRKQFNSSVKWLYITGDDTGNS